MEKRNKIYHLERNGVPFYVGKTMAPNRRLSNHKRTYGSDIKMIVIDEGEEYGELENQWIEHYTQLGYKLKNKRKGGGGKPATGMGVKTILNNVTKEIQRDIKSIKLNIDYNNIEVVEKYLNKHGYHATYNKLLFSIMDKIYKEYTNGWA